MAYDLNPFASGYGQSTPDSQQKGALWKAPSSNSDASLPSYLQQQPNPTLPGAANNMIRALMAGSQQQPPGGSPMLPDPFSTAALQVPQGGTQSLPAGTPAQTAPYAGATPYNPADASIAALFSQPPSF